MKQINLNNFVLLLVAFLWVGCKTSTRIPRNLPERSFDEIYQVIEKHNIDFDWFSAKADADITSSKVSGSGDLRLRVKKDSLIWMVGKKLSIEGVRVNITPLEYATIYRQDNAYQKEPFSYLSHMAGFELNFEDLHHILIGNIILPDTSTIHTMYKSLDHYIIKASIDQFEVDYEIDALRMQLDKVVLKDRKGQNLSIAYSDYKNLDEERILAHQLSLTFESDQDTAVCKIKFKDVILDVAKRTPFSIPSHYTRIY